MNALLILFIGGAVLTAGDILFKFWVEKNGVYFSGLYTLGIFLYLIGSMFLVQSYKYNMNIVAAGIIQVLFNTIILVVVSYFYFNETLTATQVVGVVLGIISIYLIK
jgi:drug/metabolite transporter (DMT)-like permease